MFDSPCFTQISTFWSFPTYFTQTSTLWSSHLIALKLQHFDWFQNFHLISILWWFPPLHQNFNILMDLITNFVLTFQQYDWFPTLSSNFNILINSPLFTQTSTFWSTHLIVYVLKLQHFDWFQNLNLISVLWWIPLYIQISTFWWIWHFALKLFDSPCFTQISTFWSIPLLHFDQFPNCP